MGRGRMSSFKKCRVQRLDNVIVDLSCLRVDLPSLSSSGVVRVLKRVQADLNFVIEGFRMLEKGEAEVVPVSGIEEGKRAGCVVLPCVPVSGIQEEGKGQIA